jgi:hypothetical protein
MISSMLKPCILVAGLAGVNAPLSRDVDGPASASGLVTVDGGARVTDSELRARMSGGSGSFLRNIPSPMLVPGVGSGLDLCRRSRRICSWGRCGGSGGASGGGGRIVYEDEGEL